MTTRFIDVNAVVIAADRQRRTFEPGAMRELVASIQAHGLFHAITLRQEGEDYVLVAGERRLKAVQELASLDDSFTYDGREVPLHSIPYVLLGDLDELAREEAELDENIRRENLSWQERAAATARLMELRQKQAARGDVPVPSVNSISTEIRGTDQGFQRETVRRELVVAKHLDKPEIAGAKTVEEAYKVLKRQEDQRRNAELGAQVGRVFTADLHRLHNEDALGWLRSCSAERFDVILTDPPYGMGADSFGDSGGLAAGAHGYEDSRSYFETLMEVFCPHSFRVAKPSAHAYVFCDLDNFFDLRLWMSEAGWKVFRTPLIWHKPNGMRAPWPLMGPYRRYEICLFAVKGDRPVTKLQPDLITFPPDKNLGHAAQKPVALFEDLLRRSVKPGDMVLDPFCGSGTIFPAAHELKCVATGVEMSQESYGVAIKRIEALKAQGGLPV